MRLRQVVIAASELEPVVEELRAALPLGEPYSDPGVALFGLRNAVMALGDTFLEVVSPVQEGTAAGRFLAARGGDGAYMLIFQVDDLAGARARLPELGVRVVWEIELPDIATVHLHPRDVPGAIVSLDRPDPPESWRWAGPEWTGGAPATGPGCVVGALIRAPDPGALEHRWAEVLGADPAHAGVRFEPGERAEVASFLLDVPGFAELTVAGTKLVGV